MGRGMGSYEKHWKIRIRRTGSQSVAAILGEVRGGFVRGKSKVPVPLTKFFQSSVSAAAKPIQFLAVSHPVGKLYANALKSMRYKIITLPAVKPSQSQSNRYAEENL